MSHLPVVPKLLKVKELAARLGISESDVYKLIKADKIKCLHPGGGRNIYITEEQLAAYQDKFTAA